MIERLMRSIGYEKRSASYTDAVVQLILGQARGGQALPTATAAVEAAAGLVGRSFASATVSGLRSEAIPAPFLALVGRCLIRRGECVFLIETEPELTLLPVQSYSVTGGSSPASWQYELTIGAPSKSETKKAVPIDGVIHLRYAVDPERPWQGISPLQAASISGRLGAAASAALADEAGAPHGSFLPVPQSDESDDGLKGDIRNAAGSMLMVESMAGNWEAGGPAPKDWEPRRFGFDAPASLVDLEKQIFVEILAACGIPPALFDSNSATASRESYRQFLHSTVAPIGRVVEAELREKLDSPDLAIDWTELRAADIAGRARAFSSMVKAGMDLQQAAAVSGVLSDSD